MYHLPSIGTREEKRILKCADKALSNFLENASRLGHSTHRLVSRAFFHEMPKSYFNTPRSQWPTEIDDTFLGNFLVRIRKALVAIDTGLLLAAYGREGAKWCVYLMKKSPPLPIKRAPVPLAYMVYHNLCKTGGYIDPQELCQSLFAPYSIINDVDVRFNILHEAISTLLIQACLCKKPLHLMPLSQTVANTLIQGNSDRTKLLHELQKRDPNIQPQEARLLIKSCMQIGDMLFAYVNFYDSIIDKLQLAQIVKDIRNKDLMTSHKTIAVKITEIFIQRLSKNAQHMQKHIPRMAHDVYKRIWYGQKYHEKECANYLRAVEWILVELLQDKSNARLKVDELNQRLKTAFKKQLPNFSFSSKSAATLVFAYYCRLNPTDL